MDDKFLTVREVMSILKISRRTIYYWIQDGILKPVKIGRGYRFHASEIDELTEASCPANHLPASAKRILAVDDDLLVRESLKPLLSRAGYNVTVAASGDQALEFISRTPFNMVLTDIRMPGMTGIQLLKRIRKGLEAAHKPLLPEMVFTAFDDLDAMNEAKKMGVREFMMKPFELSDFLAAINRCLA